MYSTKTAITISLKDLLDKLDDYTIYSYYLGPFKPGKLMNSPLRNDDKMPSFAIFRTNDGALLFKDHGTGVSGNAITFVKLYKGIESRPELEKELLNIIRKMNPMRKKINTSYTRVPSSINIGIVRQPFTETDINYWNQFCISKETLEKFNVSSIRYFLCNKIVRAVYKEDNPMYAYKVDDKFKIYRPWASKYTKWRTNLTNKNIQGLAQLPNTGGNLLIITKSLKDVMCLYEMGFSAIAASSETTFIPNSILKSLLDKWKHIIILYDRDKTGMKTAREYSKKYKLDAIFVHKKFKAKDISDAVKGNGFFVVKEWLTKTVERYVE